MASENETRRISERAANSLMGKSIIALEYAVAATLWALGVVILIHTIVQFVQHRTDFTSLTIQGIDGILVVIIVLDIAHTVLRQLHSTTLPIRPFLHIGVLAGIRDILSASAHLSFGGPLPHTEFVHTLIALGVGVGVVAALTVSLWILQRSEHED